MTTATNGAATSAASGRKREGMRDGERSSIVVMTATTNIESITTGTNCTHPAIMDPKMLSTTCSKIVAIDPTNAPPALYKKYLPALALDPFPSSDFCSHTFFTGASLVVDGNVLTTKHHLASRTIGGNV